MVLILDAMKYYTVVQCGGGAESVGATENYV